MQFVFGDYELDTDRFELRRNGTPCPIEPQVFDVLHYLVVHRDRVVTKHELLDNVWGDRFVSESALTSRIKAARKVLGDTGRAQDVIRTAHGRGYRFVATVTEVEGRPATPPATATATASTRNTGMTPDGARPSLATRQRAITEDWPLIGRRALMETIADWFADPERGGVVLVGAAGMGKTRLAEELSGMAEAAGIPVERASGHAEASTIPLAALAHLVPTDVVGAQGDDGLDRATMFHRARAALVGDGPRRLLFVDDADRVDEVSRALLASLVDEREVFALFTMRSGTEQSGSMDDLVKDGHLERVELDPLRADEVETLLHRALGDPVVSQTTNQFRDASLGNPGIIRHLVDSARTAGSLVRTNGVWQLAGPLGTTPTLEGLVADRLTGLDDAQQHAIELVAVAGEIGLDVVAGQVGDEPLEDLERRGLLVVRERGRRAGVALAHPLYDEIVRARLPALAARRLRRELAESIEQRGARRREDRVRIVAWRTEIGGHVDPELLVHAARLAVLDHDLDVARKLLERSVADQPTPEAVVMLAEIAFRQGRTERVEELLSGIDVDQLDDHQRARVARRRATNLFFNTMRYQESFALLDDAIEKTTDSAVRTALEAHSAMLLANGGQVNAAIARAESALTGSTGETRLELLRALGLSYVHAARPLAGLELAREGQRLHDQLDNDVSLPGLSMLMFIEMAGLTATLRIDEARETAERVKREHPEVVATWIDNSVGRLELLAGRPAAARRALTSVVNDARARGHDTTERWVLALHATAHLLEGRVDLAEPELERVASQEDGGRGLYHPEIDRAHAWFAAATGDLERAHRLLWVSAEDCTERGAIGMTSALLHDVARFGDPTAVAERLGEIAAVSDGDLFIARSLHVSGMVDGDPALVERAADLFERGGAALFGAEAAAALATVHRQQGDAAAAEAATARSESLRRSEGIRLVSPALG